MKKSTLSIYFTIILSLSCLNSFCSDDLGDSIIIKPNPATTYIVLKSDKLSIRSINIINSLGSTVLKKYDPPGGIIEINHLNQGLYFISIETDKGTVIKKIQKE